MIAAATAAILLLILYHFRGEPDFNNSRLAYLRDHGEEFNVLFAGSSISMRNVDPARFDSTLAQYGFASRSFNLGMGGADMHQINWAVRVALGTGLPNLKYVFIDLRPFEVDVPEQYRLTPPAIRWHDLHETRSALQTGDVADASPHLKREARRRHHQHFLYKYVPVGMLIKPVVQGEEAEFEPSRQGYEPYDPESEKVRRKRQEFMEELPAYQAAVGRKRRHEYGSYDLEHYNQGALQEQIELIRAAGATPIYWIPASADDYDFAEALRRADLLPLVLKFDDAELYPHLFEPALRMDRFHLNNEGTQIFTPLLAERFMDAMDRRPDLPVARSGRLGGASGG